MVTNGKVSAIAGALAVCVAGGALCAWLRTPLPWMIGPLVAMAIFQFSGANLAAPPWGREAGQLTIGVSLGLYFTPPVVAEVLAYGGWFVALGFASIGVGAASGAFLARAAGVDRATAFFGSMPGGAAEMAMIGEKHGALPDRVALSHSMRMLFVVTLVPVGITLAGFSGSDDYRPVAIAFDVAGLAALAITAVAAGLLARRLRAPTAFMIGPLFATIALTVAGVHLSSVPTPLSNAAQVLLACALGARFQQSFVREAPRFVAALIPAVLITLALAALVGAGLAWGAGAYLGTALLAAAPGGIAEMSITAKVLRIGVAFVTAAHVTRFVIVVIFSSLLFRYFDRTRGNGEPR